MFLSKVCPRPSHSEKGASSHQVDGGRSLRLNFLGLLFHFAHPFFCRLSVCLQLLGHNALADTLISFQELLGLSAVILLDAALHLVLCAAEDIFHRNVINECECAVRVSCEVLYVGAVNRDLLIPVLNHQKVLNWRLRVNC